MGPDWPLNRRCRVDQDVLGICPWRGFEASAATEALCGYIDDAQLFTDGLRAACVVVAQGVVGSSNNVAGDSSCSGKSRPTTKEMRRPWGTLASTPFYR